MLPQALLTFAVLTPAQAVGPISVIQSIVWWFAAGWALASLLVRLARRLERYQVAIAVCIGLLGLALSFFSALALQVATQFWWVAVLVVLIITGPRIYRWSQAAIRSWKAAFMALQALARFLAERGSQIAESEDREQIYRAHLKLHGLGFEKREVVLDIRPDGSTNARVRFTVVAASGRWDRIGHFFDEVNITDETRVDLESQWAGEHRIYVDEIERSGTRLACDFRFVPSIAAGNSVQVNCSTGLGPGSFATRASDLREPFKPEYFFRASIPTREFSVKILFPKEVEPTKWEYGVSTGLTNLRHEAEFARIREFVGDGRTEPDRRFYVEAKIPFPLTGVTYWWRWEPLRS